MTLTYLNGRPMIVVRDFITESVRCQDSKPGVVPVRKAGEAISVGVLVIRDPDEVEPV